MALNTVGEELFATTFVAVLAKVGVSSLRSPDFPARSRQSLPRLLRHRGVALPPAGARAARRNRLLAGFRRLRARARGLLRA